MDKDRVKGATQEVTGKAKTKAGKMLGDEKLKMFSAPLVRYSHVPMRSSVAAPTPIPML